MMTDIEHFIESFGLRYDKFQSPKLLENENLNFQLGEMKKFFLASLASLSGTSLIF